MQAEKRRKEKVSKISGLSDVRLPTIEVESDIHYRPYNDLIFYVRIMGRGGQFCCNLGKEK